jgi:ATP-binding cassette subfamily F protein 3
VSHDRYFISKTANKIWEIVDHKVKEFKGGYEEYVEWKQRQSLQTIAKNQEPVKSYESNEPEKSNAKPTIDKQNTKPKQDSAGSATKELKKELQKQQRIFQQLEEKIAKITEQKRLLETALADPATYSDKNKFLQTEAEYKKITQDLENLNSEYEKVFEKLMELEK